MPHPSTERLAAVLALAFGCAACGPPMPPGYTGATLPPAPPEVPEAPTQAKAVGGPNGMALVFWRPSLKSDRPILRYQVVSNPGGITATVGARITKANVEGLTNNRAYTFAVYAISSAGESPASNETSPPVFTYLLPDAPTAVHATALGSTITVTWKPPANDDGVSIKAYQVASSGSLGVHEVSYPATSATFPNAYPGHTYTFTVIARADTASGGFNWSKPSAPSNPVTIVAVPSRMNAPQAKAGDRQATVTWMRPADVGGAPLTTYTVTTEPGGATLEVPAGTLTATVTGLTNGTGYTFTVFATNGLGPGPVSDPSTAVYPGVVPSAPTGVRATITGTTAFVGWTAPYDGGSPITRYRIRSLPDRAEAVTTGAATAAQIPNLSPGVAYRFTVVAINAFGAGPPSAPSVDQPPTQTLTDARSTFSVAPDDPTSLGTVALTASLRDVDGKPIPGDAVWFISTVPTDQMPVGAEDTGPNGIAVASLVHPASGTRTLIARTGDGDLDLDVTSVLPTCTTTVRLGTAAAIATGAGVTHLAVADLDRDGHLDLVVARSAAGQVGVLRGNGDGTFAAETDLSAGTAPGALAVGDLDGDGIPDLVVADDVAPGALSIRLGNGDGTFGTAATVTTGAHPDAVAIADVNRDGHPDLLVADRGADAVSVLLGHGDGTFAPDAEVAAGPGPLALAVADLDGDGIPDLVVADGGGTSATVLLGKGDGTFGAPATVDLGGAPSALVVTDLDGDGHPDLAAAEATGAVVVRLGNGDGTFAAPTRIPAGTAPLALATADLDGDGHPDLVAGGPAGVTVLQSAGAGGFTALPPVAAGTGPVALAVGDLDGRGRPDLVAADAAGAVAGLRNEVGPIPVTLVPSVNVPLASASESLVVIDMNGDGIPDLVAGESSGGLAVRLGNGSGAFPTEIDPTTLDSFQRDIAVGDVDRDGLPDVVTTNSFDNRVVLYRGTGGGHLAPGIPVSLPGAAWQVALVDLNHDGSLDLVALDRVDAEVFVRLGNGDGTFLPAITDPSGVNDTTLAVADLDRDGNEDLVVAGIDGFSVLLGNGDGTFAAPLTTKLSSFGPAPVVADVNRDGIPDLVIVDSGVLDLYLGNGDGTFRHTTTAIPPAVSLTVADLDHDGIPDLVTFGPAPPGPSGPSQLLDVALGNGDGTFRAPIPTNAAQHLQHLVAADLDGNGNLDLVGTGSSGAVAVFIETGCP